MKIDDLTIGEAKQLAAMFSGTDASVTAITTPHIGKSCIIRCYASGVHFGTVTAQSGRQVELENSRRLWRFDVKDHGISLSEVANHGGTCGTHRYCEALSSITLLDAIEVIPCTDKAIDAIRSAPVASAK